MKNNKGITLIALSVMIIVILILASITTTTGLNVIKESRFNKVVAEMKIMQTKVNELYDEYRENKIQPTDYGVALNTTNNTTQEEIDEAYTSVYETIGEEIGEKTHFRYYSSDYIKNTLDIDGVDGDYIINIETRTVIYIEGIEIDDDVFYSLDEIEGEQFNVR